MEQHEPNDIPAASPSSTSPGRTLREARERLGMSLADVAGQLKFATRQIEALEADDYQRLPEMMFVRGFVRNYAKLLELDAQPLLDALPQTRVVPEQVRPASVEVPFHAAPSARQQNLIWLGAALLVALVAAGFALWHFATPQQGGAGSALKVQPVEMPVFLPEQAEIVAGSPVQEAKVLLAPSLPAAAPAKSSVASVQPLTKLAKPVMPPIPSSVQAAKPLAQIAPPQPPKPVIEPNAVSSTAVLRLVFDDESWTEIKDKSGKTLSSQVNPRGSELRLDGRAPFTLVIGHAAAVRVYLRGKQVDLKSYTHSTSEVARLTLE